MAWFFIIPFVLCLMAFGSGYWLLGIGIIVFGAAFVYFFDP